MPLTTVSQGLLSTDAQYTGFKNRLINGDMTIDQRNNGASYSPTNLSVVYGADRWLTFSAGAGVTAQRINNSGVTGFPFAFRQTGASGNTYASFVQRIESANCLDLVGQQVTVSLFVATSNSSNVRIGLEYAGSTDNFGSPVVIQQQTIATTSTLTRYSVTFNALPSQVANGIQLDIEAASGIGAGVTFTVTGVQLEKGNVATSFDVLPYTTELALCQRYCVAYGGSNVYENVGYGFAYITGAVDTITALPVQMRTAPSFSVVGSWQISDGAVASVIFVLSLAALQFGSQQVALRATSSGLTQFRPYRIEAANSTVSRIFFTAEL
jgi:hypothetical protein